MTRASNIAYHPAALDSETGEPKPIEPIRSRIARPTEAPLATTGHVADERLREEIETLRRYVETAAYLLGQDAAIRYRHATEFDNLRHVEKMLGQISPLIDAADRDAAIERIGDGELKARLKRKPLTPWFESKH